MTYPYRLRRLLPKLSRAAPEHVRELRRIRREVHNGLCPVGLKIHALDGGAQFMPIIEALGGRKKILEVNHYRRKTDNETVCWVLPPVGNASAAVLLLEAIELTAHTKIFLNPNIQIQVCSPGRLSEESAALLTIGFCLASDQLRRFFLSDLETTFSSGVHERVAVGRRITIYDASYGKFDRQFEWWARSGSRRVVQRILPFRSERTDVLTATSPRDIHNINLMATLLVHDENRGYWGRLGLQFRHDMLKILHRHMLSHILEAPWIKVPYTNTENDNHFVFALNELMNYAYEDAFRIRQNQFPHFSRSRFSSILIDVRDLITRTHKQLVDEARMNSHEGDSDVRDAPT